MERDETPRRHPGTPRRMRMVFGIFMILFYVTIGMLILIGKFNFYGEWEWLRWVSGIILVAYGIWRGYRQFAAGDDDA